MTAAPAIVESALAIACEGETLVGILSRPAQAQAALGVLIAVGGPQYRAGSHRQFVSLARHLAARGVSTLRFDYRGMGDSTGAMRAFDDVRADFDAALARLQRECPQVRRVVVWGLCDAASGALLFAAADPRVAGLVLLNPWVRESASLAQVHLKHYYRARLLQGEFWRKLLSGGFDWRRAAGGLLQNLRLAREPATSADSADFRAGMLRGLERFGGRVLLVLSGKDLTAQEFSQVTGSSPRWRGALARASVQRVEIADADHTFSQRRWQRDVEALTAEFLKSLS
jgi:exosortase A-associated hydrolase 1